MVLDFTTYYMYSLELIEAISVINIKLQDLSISKWQVLMNSYLNENPHFIDLKPNRFLFRLAIRLLRVNQCSLVAHLEDFQIFLPLIPV